MGTIKIILKKESDNKIEVSKNLESGIIEPKYFVSEEEFWGDVKKEVLLSVKMMLELVSCEKPINQS